MLVEWIIGKFNPGLKDRSSLAIVNWAFRWVIRLSGTKVIAIGEENIPTDTAVLYVGNHRSFFDVVLTYVRVPRPTGYIAKKEILKIIEKYADEKTPLMMILSDVQSKYGYIPLEVQEIISEATGIPVAEIYGVITFYSFFSLKPKGKYVIGVCLGTACYVKGAQQVCDKFCELLNVAPGETTEDGLFTIDALRCIGACGIAPAVTINGKVYPKLTVQEVPKIINAYRTNGGEE